MMLVVVMINDVYINSDFCDFAPGAVTNNGIAGLRDHKRLFKGAMGI